MPVEAPTSTLTCRRCHTGLLVPFVYDDWGGPLACSKCGAAVRLNPQNPRSEGADSGSRARQSRQESKSHHVGGQRLVIGGVCKSGQHVLTERNLYISPKGVATCKDCRKARRRG
jgi:hypothetical protein